MPLRFPPYIDPISKHPTMRADAQRMQRRQVHSARSTFRRAPAVFISA